MFKCSLSGKEYNSANDFIAASDVAALRAWVRDNNPTELSGTMIATLKRSQLEQVIRGEVMDSIVIDSVSVKPQKTQAKLPSFMQELGTFVESEVDRAIQNRLPKEHYYIATDRPDIKPMTTRQHYMFPLVQVLIRTCGVNTYLYGEKGNGKSTLAINAVKSLGLDPAIIACDRDSTKGYFLGYMDATGKYVPGLVYNAYKNGGCIILEEFDSLSPGVRLCLNNLIANSYFTFPNCETVERNKEFRVVSTGNTMGIGATSNYTARQAQDQASIDRFAYLEIPIDLGLEACISQETCPTKLISPTLDLSEGYIPNPSEWLSICRDYRQAIVRANLQNGVSTRSVIMGNLLANQGIGKSHLIPMLLTKCMSSDQVTKVNSLLMGGY